MTRIAEAVAGAQRHILVSNDDWGEIEVLFRLPTQKVATIAGGGGQSETSRRQNSQPRLALEHATGQRRPGQAIANRGDADAPPRPQPRQPNRPGIRLSTAAGTIQWITDLGPRVGEVGA